MLRQELIPTLQQFAGTVEQPVKLDIGSLDKDIQELIYEGYLIISLVWRIMRKLSVSGLNIWPKDWKR